MEFLADDNSSCGGHLNRFRSFGANKLSGFDSIENSSSGANSLTVDQTIMLAVDSWGLNLVLLTHSLSIQLDSDNTSQVSGDMHVLLANGLLVPPLAIPNSEESSLLDTNSLTSLDLVKDALSHFLSSAVMNASVLLN